MPSKVVLSCTDTDVTCRSPGSSPRLTWWSDSAATVGHVFLRARPPERRWAALWPVIETLGGRLRRDDLDAFSDLLVLLDDAGLDDVDRAVTDVLRTLDTERHAAALAGTPWRGQGRPFSVRRFQLTRERVMSSGPQAVAAVMAEPELLVSYDDPSALGPRTRIRPDGPARRVADELLVRGLLDRPRPPLLPIATRRGRWPSLGRTGYAFEPHDPDHVWLRVDSVVGGRWRRSVVSAGAVVVNRLGASPRAPSNGAPLWTLEVDLAPWGRRPVDVTTDDGRVRVYASVDDDPRQLPAEIARVLHRVVDTWTPSARRALDDLLAPTALDVHLGSEVDVQGPPIDGPPPHHPVVSLPRSRDETRRHGLSSDSNQYPRSTQGLR